MLVSDIVKTALCLVGRKDAADAIDSDDYEDDRELSHAVKAMLHCFNAAEDELARAYFPLTCEESFTPVQGKIYYTSFGRMPVRILSVTRGKRAVAYNICPEYLEMEGGEATVKYAYCPQKKQLSDDSDFDGYPVGERMLGYGAASEYCLIEGAYEEAENWEARYRAEIERFRPYKKVRPIPARAWI